MKLLAVTGSARRLSHNTGLLRAAAEEAPAGIEVELWDGLGRLPIYDEDAETTPGPEAVEEFRAAVAAADAVLIATPEYNHSIPGGLKNALDWASRPLAANPFRFTPVAVVGASTGMFGAVWAQAELRKVLTAMGARVLDLELPVGRAHERFDETGRLEDAETRARLAEVVAALVEAVEARELTLAA
jgi:chromate reductase